MHRIAMILLAMSFASAALSADVEFVCVDGSKLRAKLLDERLEVKTKYGVLTIPESDVHRITFAMRLTAAESKRIDDLIVGLGNSDFETREKADTELRDLRERAYPTVVKAAKNPDAEISRRAVEIAARLRGSIPEDILSPPALDEIHTADGSVIRGTIAASSLRVRTAMFAEQKLHLTDTRRLEAVAKK
jgi:hypothetical protein